MKSAIVEPMPEQIRIVTSTPIPRTVKSAEGILLTAPAEWVLVPPGDAGLTRRIKAAGPTWTVQEKKGRKIFSKGVWASATTVSMIQNELAIERATPQYANKRKADVGRRERDQAEYVQTFQETVFEFLAFHPRYAELAKCLAEAVAAHATPVGSGTVARTKRIPVEERAEAAVIAWMRHQTTGYDEMSIARVKGKRREVRRQLAAQSKKRLEAYRLGNLINPLECPLARSLFQKCLK